MNLALFEDAGWRDLLPLTWLRACFELRCGRDRLEDKIRRHFGGGIARVFVRPALKHVVHQRTETVAADPGADWCLINARTFVTGDVPPPPPGAAWWLNGELVAATVPAARLARFTPEVPLAPDSLGRWTEGLRAEPLPENVQLVCHAWDLIQANAAELRRQCQQGGTQAGQVYPGAHLVQPGQIHIGRGARIKPGAVLDAEDGPVHVDEGAVIQPNAVLEGPCCIGRNTIVRSGASIRAGTTIGPVCKVGGEIEGTIIHGYANKQHDGFLGHSYVAEWVNLGADTVTSDLKNTYGTIRVSLSGVPVETGQHFLGSIIADHSKTGIGTILPTGCVIGVAANVFKSDAVPKFVPSFAWLTDEGMLAYRVEKAIHIAEIVMNRREVDLTTADRELLEEIAKTVREVEAAGWD